jgi:LysM repeat protein
VQLKKHIQFIMIVLIFCALVLPANTADAIKAPSAPMSAGDVTAFDLIIAMNTLRASYGLAVLAEDPIIDAVAQSTANIMAANQMSWHIGDVPGRLTASGYGGGAKVYGTENFALGNMSIDEIMVVWSDASHMIPAVNPAYCNVGAGVAKSPNGMTYYVLQAAYTSNKSCGEYKSPTGTTTNKDGTTMEGRVNGVSQLVVPVKIATPDADGKIYHVVEAGQSFWSIAVAYKLTIKDLEIWNNLSKNSKLQIGQRLFIPGNNTAGYATPTPVGMILVSQPEKDGKIIHVVQSYQTLSTISQAYSISIDQILSQNGLKIDWPLQVGQKLLIRPSLVTATATPLPLTPAEKLTPAADGKYYHTIKSGETISGIAGLYKISINDLAGWNGMTSEDIIRVGQKLLLQITPPATKTATPGPTTTPQPTLTPSASSTITETPGPTQVLVSNTPAAQTASSTNVDVLPYLAMGLLILSIITATIYMRNRRKP